MQSTSMLVIALRNQGHCWWFWTAMAVIVALSAIICSYFILGGLVAWHQDVPDRGMGMRLFVISFFSLLCPPVIIFLSTRPFIRNPETEAAKGI